MKKTINKGRRVVAKQTLLPALYDKEMAEAAKRSLSRMRVPTQGSRISLKGKQFTVGGRSFGNELKVAVIDFGYAHAYYPGVYNEKNPQPPVCFSLGLVTEGLVPHPIAPDKQHADCATCPKNEFGSATTGTGRGKACKDIVRIAVMHESSLESPEAVADGKIATLDLPAMSLKGWDEYANNLVRKTERELLAFVTIMTFDPKPTYPVVLFDLDGPIDDNGVIVALGRRQKEADEMILAPWQPLSAEKRKAGAATGRDAAVRKTGTGRSRFK